MQRARWRKPPARTPRPLPGVSGLHLLGQRPGGREGAFAARKLFEETFPGVKVCMGYDIPYFKVSVGNCLTTEEAIILKERVSATFPKAFVKSEELSAADLTE